MTQQLLTIASALIPGSLMVWFLAAIATKIFTRWQMARRQPQLVKVQRAIATATTKPPKALPVPPSVTFEIPHLEPAQTTPTPYETMTLAQLRKVARKCGVVPSGDARQRKSWLDALVTHS